MQDKSDLALSDIQWNIWSLTLLYAGIFLYVIIYSEQKSNKKNIYMWRYQRKLPLWVATSLCRKRRQNYFFWTGACCNPIYRTWFYCIFFNKYLNLVFLWLHTQCLFRLSLLCYLWSELTEIRFFFLKFTIYWTKRLIGSYTSPYWRSGISSTSVRNAEFLSRVEEIPDLQ